MTSRPSYLSLTANLIDFLAKSLCFKLVLAALWENSLGGMDPGELRKRRIR